MKNINNFDILYDHIRLSFLVFDFYRQNFCGVCFAGIKKPVYLPTEIEKPIDFDPLKEAGTPAGPFV